MRLTQGVLTVIWRGMVALHFLVIFAMIVAMFVLPFRAAWYVALPLEVYILNLMFTPVACAMTKAENILRKAIGLPEIRFFIGHYIVRPFKKPRALDETQ
jgi:hypothetical protein